MMTAASFIFSGRAELYPRCMDCVLQPDPCFWCILARAADVTMDPLGRKPAWRSPEPNKIRPAAPHAIEPSGDNGAGSLKLTRSGPEIPPARGDATPADRAGGGERHSAASGLQTSARKVDR
jgi:hypothetical protein